MDLMDGMDLMDKIRLPATADFQQVTGDREDQYQDLFTTEGTEGKTEDTAGGCATRVWLSQEYLVLRLCA